MAGNYFYLMPPIVVNVQRVLTTSKTLSSWNRRKSAQKEKSAQIRDRIGNADVAEVSQPHIVTFDHNSTLSKAHGIIVISGH